MVLCCDNLRDRPCAPLPANVPNVMMYQEIIIITPSHLTIFLFSIHPFERFQSAYRRHGVRPAGDTSLKDRPLESIALTEGNNSNQLPMSELMLYSNYSRTKAKGNSEPLVFEVD